MTAKKKTEEPAWYEEVGGDVARYVSGQSDSAVEYVAKSVLTTLIGGGIIYGAIEGGKAIFKATTNKGEDKDAKSVINIAS